MTHEDRANDQASYAGHECAKCGVTLDIPVGYDPTEFCCGCAHDEIARLRTQTSPDRCKPSQPSPAVSLTREQIETIRRVNERMPTAAVNRRDVLALCDMALASLAAPPSESSALKDAQEGWIPVTERLPDHDRPVFVKYADGELGVDACEEGGWNAYENGLEHYHAVAGDEMTFGMTPPIAWAEPPPDTAIAQSVSKP